MKNEKETRLGRKMATEASQCSQCSTVIVVPSMEDDKKKKTLASGCDAQDSQRQQGVRIISCSK